MLSLTVVSANHCPSVDQAGPVMAQNVGDSDSPAMMHKYTRERQEVRQRPDDGGTTIGGWSSSSVDCRMAESQWCIT